MATRDRVFAALAHGQPDRTPVSLGTICVDGFTRFALEAYAGFTGRLETFNLTNQPMQTVETPDWLLADLGCEFRTVRVKSPLKDVTKFHSDGSYTDEYGIYYQKSEMYYDPVRGPLYGDISEKDIEQNPMPDPIRPRTLHGAEKALPEIDK